MKFQLEITDTFGGEANYSWVRRESFTMPELTYYGYDGALTYVKALNKFNRALKKKVKDIAGWHGARCTMDDYGDVIEIRPNGACLVAFITPMDNQI
jgi:hypothetical protein